MMFKKTTALVLAIAMMVGAAGCGSMGKDLSWAAQLGEDKISAGVYVLNVLSGLNAASQLAPAGVSDFLTGEIEGKPAADFVKEYAKNESMRQLAVHQKFVALGLSIDSAEMKQYEDYAKQMFATDGDMYKANGVSEQSLLDYNRYSYEAFRVFAATYTGEGEKAATPEEIAKYFGDTYYLSYIVPYLKVDPATGAPLSAEELKKVTDEVNASYKAIEDGKNIVDVIYEVGQKNLPADTAAPERGKDGDYMMVVDKVDTGMFPPLVNTYLATAELDKVELIEDETFMLIIQKKDETKPDPTIAEYYYGQMLPQLKQVEYQELCLEWGNAAGITWNEDSLNHYTGAKVKKETDAFRLAKEAESASAAASQAAADAAKILAEAGAAGVSGTEASSTAPESAPAADSSSK